MVKKIALTQDGLKALSIIAAQIGELPDAAKPFSVASTSSQTPDVTPAFDRK